MPATTILADGSIVIDPASLGATPLHQAIQTANDQCRDAFGGKVIVKHGVWVLTGGFRIDVGSGVSFDGQSSIFNASGISGSVAIITLSSRPPATGTGIPNFDNTSRNYHQKRAVVERFTLIGSTDVGVTTTGISIYIDPSANAIKRAPRSVVRNVVIDGFKYGIQHKDFAYLCEFENGGVVSAKVGLSYEGGVDQGENTSFKNWAFGSCDVAVQTNTGTENVDVQFHDCSFDHNLRVVQHISGYGRVRFGVGCHVEWADDVDDSAIPVFDMSASATNRMLWFFESPNIISTGANPVYPFLFSVGVNHDVRVRDPFLHNIRPTGLQMTGDRSPTGGPTYASAIAQIVGNGRFSLEGTSELISTQLPAIPTIAADNSWLADGGFALSSSSVIVDPWFARDAAGPVQINSVYGHSDSQSLQVPITSNSGTAPKSVRVLVPKNGDFVSAQAFARVSPGASGSAAINLTPVLVLGTPAVNTVPSVLRRGSVFNGQSVALSSAGWVRLNAPGTSPRLKIPKWANFIEINIDLIGIANANGGYVLVDDVQIEQW